MSRARVVGVSGKSDDFRAWPPLPEILDHRSDYRLIPEVLAADVTKNANPDTLCGRGGLSLNSESHGSITRHGFFCPIATIV